MKRLILIGIIQLGIFTTILVLLQDADFYHHTLGKIAQNYTRVDLNGKSKIIESSIPFVLITDDKFDRWDASIYRCIRDRMYNLDEGCYHNVRGAFFPLFPLLWRLSGLNNIGISILNYVFYLFSLALLFTHLSRCPKNNGLTFAVLLTFPTAVIFYMPYTEGLFMLMMTIMVLGLLQGRYLIYFIGALLMAMVRPATLFVLLALLAVKGINYLRERDLSRFIMSLIRCAMPFFFGYLLTAVIQRYYSGSWTTFFDAQKLWHGGRLTPITKISDWSVEGFGMSSFAVFFVGLPACLYLIYFIIKALRGKGRLPLDKREMIWLLSLFYLAGIFLYILLTSGGNLHSFWRFTLASPPFFIAIIIYLSKVRSGQISPIFLNVILPGILLTLFLNFVPYGGNRMDYSFAGMFLCVLSWCFLTLSTDQPNLRRMILVGPLILLNMVWNAFLFNAFLSQAWIFT